MRAQVLASYVGRLLVVNLKTGHAIAGTLARADNALLVIADGALHHEGRSPVDLGGEVIIALDNVDFAIAKPA